MQDFAGLKIIQLYFQENNATFAAHFSKTKEGKTGPVAQLDRATAF
jgi:hypothetical protein